VDVGCTNIKYTWTQKGDPELLGLVEKAIEELPSDECIRDEQRFRKLFKEGHSESLLKSLDKRNFQKFLVCLPGKIGGPDGEEFLREDDAVEGIPRKCAEMIQDESGCPEITLMNDAEAWGLGYLHYLQDQKKKIKLPAVLFTFGTGVGACLLYEEGEFTIAKGYELNEHPDEFIETAKAAEWDRVYQEQIHKIIGQDFFPWADKELDDEKRKTEFTKRVVALVNDLQESDAFRNKLSGKKICTLFFGGGNAHLINVEEVKKKVEGVKEIIAPRTPIPSEIESIPYKYHQCLDVSNGGEVKPLDPRFIPLLGFKGKIKTVYINELDVVQTAIEGKEEELEAEENEHKTKQPQTITFPDPGDGAVDLPLDLNATSDSGLPVTYRITAGANKALLSGSELTGTVLGDVTVEVTQTGDNCYCAATPASQIITIKKALDPDPEEKTICIIDPSAINANSRIKVKSTIEKKLQDLKPPLKFLNPDNWTAKEFDNVIDSHPSHSKTSVYLVIDARRTWPDGQRIEKLKDLKDKMKQVILVLVRNPETEKTTKLDSWKSEADKLKVKCDEVVVTE
jgi:hypothetical protein